MHSPSELSKLDRGFRVSVGGRLTSVFETGFVLADAFGSCSVFLQAPRTLPTLGSWLVVTGEVDDRLEPTLCHAALVEVAPGALFPDGYFSRFSRIGPYLAARNAATKATRHFFEHRDFVEVCTPVRVLAPGTDVYLEPQPSEERWLITSPEFHHKRLLAGGLPRIFEFARCTRKGERGLWHHPEFTMLEWYRAFADVETTMAQTEALAQHVASALGVNSVVSMKGVDVDVFAPFERLTVADAFRRFAGIDDVAALAADDEDRYFQLMVDRVEPAVARFSVPVFLTHYPQSQAALARRSATMPGFAERFELFMGGVELCNGYGELTDADEQAARFASDVQRRSDKGLPALPVDEGLLSALREGLPPCSGNAVGFDRLVSVLLGQALDDVVAFP